jgi:hypothetical protein
MAPPGRRRPSIHAEGTIALPRDEGWAVEQRSSPAHPKPARGLIHKVGTPLRFDTRPDHPVGIGNKSAVTAATPTTAPPGNPDVSKTDHNVDQEHFITHV